MHTEKKFQALADIIGSTSLTTAQIVDRGGCLIANSDRNGLRYYLDKMVEVGILEKIKVKAPRREGLGTTQFGKQPCKFTYRKAGEQK